MKARLFGVDLLDVLTEGWERSSQIVIGEVKGDGSIDLLLLLDGAAFRYLATVDSRGMTGEVPAPVAFVHLAQLARQVLESNRPIVRQQPTVEPGFLLSVFPALGMRSRIVFMLEPENSDPNRD